MLFNWVDWVIIGVLFFEVYDGWKSGLISLGTSFLSFAVSLWLAIVINPSVSIFFTDKFGIASSWASVIGYIVIALLSSIVIAEIIHRLVLNIPQKIVKSKINSTLGSFISLMNGIVIIAFFLLIIVVLPLRGSVKSDIKDSKIGSLILRVMEKYSGPIKTSIDEIGSAATRFITINPASTESIVLDVSPKPEDLFIDTVGEKHMVDLINAERVSIGLSALTVDSRLTDVARSHSRDMFIERYFSHVSPDNKDSGDRLTEARIGYTIMGENIAYAPDVDTAHTGLMNSPEHKKNILESKFRHVGIGIISTKSFGLMVTQDFTD
jgi:uncharacterized protein YkwD/uncharacterized membrane protein required for colicin V production